MDEEFPSLKVVTWVRAHMALGADNDLSDYIMSHDLARPGTCSSSLNQTSYSKHMRTTHGSSNCSMSGIVNVLCSAFKPLYRAVAGRYH